MAARRLTEVEAQVLRLGAAGLHADEIAGALGLSPETVAWHLAQAYKKVGAGCDAATATEEDRPCTKSR